MIVKTDTKEKFTVITIQEATLSANMTANIKQLDSYGQHEIPHIVINMTEVTNIDTEAAQALANLQQQFYERNQSFVICGLQPAVEQVFETADLLDVMNVTPTESEAWDIVQMEEIERELLSDFDDEEN
ncbi:STAS domain-containing protein [Ferruginibacter yonginensis]|uniref:STAS domain-containing protein n=1 Tax=Ferruginibacter yonginensis TaxID=1310416 RepID=A0ABV8QPB2_9BACT